ncbi:MAG: SIS domain-containing protein [Phycisphaerae bacterium]|nr:SIS domain-containing protein [Phycisphaerae bacterium]
MEPARGRAPSAVSSIPVAARRIELALAAIRSLESKAAEIDAIAEAIAERLAAGGTVYTAGNGGSAAEALHLAEELIGRYKSNRPPYRSICLNADPTALTCIANDFGFEAVFSRQCDALVRPGDVLVLFSTSGRSPNIVQAAIAARKNGGLVIGLLGGVGGGTGGDTRPQCDVALVVDGADSGAVQEAHQVILHALCERLERP